MIEREILRREHSPAILAGIMVAQQNVLSRQAFSLEWNVNIFSQPDY